MSKESINTEIESFTTSDGNEPAQPEWGTNGVPECSESCRWHDGKRCELLGQRPGPICEPAVVSMYELLEDRGLLLNRIDGLNVQLQTQTENMRALEKERDRLREEIEKQSENVRCPEEIGLGGCPCDSCLSAREEAELLGDFDKDSLKACRASTTEDKMTNEERIALIRDSLGKIQDVSLGVDVSWLCRFALKERKTADELFAKLETERSVLSFVKDWTQAEIDSLRTMSTNLIRECATRQNVEFRLRETLEALQAEVRRLEQECSKCLNG